MSALQKAKDAGIILASGIVGAVVDTFAVIPWLFNQANKFPPKQRTKALVGAGILSVFTFPFVLLSGFVVGLVDGIDDGIDKIPLTNLKAVKAYIDDAFNSSLTSFAAIKNYFKEMFHPEDQSKKQQKSKAFKLSDREFAEICARDAASQTKIEGSQTATRAIDDADNEAESDNENENDVDTLRQDVARNLAAAAVVSVVGKFKQSVGVSVPPANAAVATASTAPRMSGSSVAS